MTELTASTSYTNKSKKVKLIYYANRSTPQTCKPGQTVHAKEGYGKRTKIKNATPEQVKQLKAGKWVRDREDGKKHNDRGAKTSKYRPKLAAKQKVARKRKLAAADYPNSKKYILTVSDGDGSLMQLLEALQKLGSDGSSRGITIEDDPTNYGFDGDGADKIYDIKVEEETKETTASTDFYRDFMQNNRR